MSAFSCSALEVLDRAVPVLAEYEAEFKVAASLGLLDRLNGGEFGRSQVGKFLVVYPLGDEQAVAIAKALDAATHGLPGPMVPYDRQFDENSLVHYRYGGFGGLVMQQASGAVVPAIRLPSGELSPDIRAAGRDSPRWTQDPFRAGFSRAEPPAGRVVDRDLTAMPVGYLAIAPLSTSGRTDVSLAIDLARLDTCVVKAPARMATNTDTRGRALLRHEAEVLAQLPAHRGLPKVRKLVTEPDCPCLILEDLRGHALGEYIGSGASGGAQGSEELAIWVGSGLVELISVIHRGGFVYRDLSSSNVLVDSKQRVSLVDFELACPIAANGAWRGGGTIGYMSPQQAAGLPPSTTDDVYGLGAVMFLAATGAEPSRAPDTSFLLSRDIRLLNPDVSRGLARIISRCLAPSRSARFQSVADVGAALAKVESRRKVRPDFRTSRMRLPESEIKRRRRSREVATELGDALCTDALKTLGAPGAAWVTRHPAMLPMAYRYVNVGAAGVVLALAELWRELRQERHRKSLIDGVHWLVSSRPFPGAVVSGLYAGEAGVGAALLRAGQVLERPSLIEKAASVSVCIAQERSASPDAFSGSAGQMRFHLLVWQETNDEAHLERARRIGSELLTSAETPTSDERCWILPSGHGDLSDRAFLGYAHGAAGIADCLIDLHEATREGRFAVAARQAARWILGQLSTASSTNGELEWGGGGRRLPGTWCHGAAGIGRLMVRLSHSGIWPDAAYAAESAARYVARSTRVLGPSRCHGLAGSISFLLDIYQATGDSGYLRAARSLELLMYSFRAMREGRLTWGSGPAGLITPDYMIGYAGVATCLLRLGDPDRLPEQLSLTGFRC